MRVPCHDEMAAIGGFEYRCQRCGNWLTGVKPRRNGGRIRKLCLRCWVDIRAKSNTGVRKGGHVIIQRKKLL